MFQNIKSYTGRIRRTEYGLSMVVAVTLIFISKDILVWLRSDVAIYFCWLPSFIFILSQGARRCHDLGRSGWTQFIVLFIIPMLFDDGQPGFNGYGPNPKGEGEFELELLEETE